MLILLSNRDFFSSFYLLIFFYYRFDKKNKMDVRVHCLYLFTLLLAAMVMAHPTEFSSDCNVHKRQKRDAVETSSCKQEIEKNGMSLFNYGID